jgi:phosphatidylinositol alpha-1,6-mannosyltransferase
MRGKARQHRRQGYRVLALVTDAFGGRGGIALYNRDVLRALCEDESVSQVVAVPRLAPDGIGELPEKLVYDLSGLGGGMAYLRAVARQVRSSDFDIIHCGHINLSPIAHVAAKLRGIPWVLSIFGIDAWQKSPRRLTAYCAGKADHLISISQVTLDRFLAFAPYRTAQHSVINNAIHLEQFGIKPRNEALQRRLGLAGRKVILTLGRMELSERYKGFDETIELLPRLIDRHPKIVYVAAGDGNDRRRLEDKAARLGLGDHVVFPGRISEHEKADLYRLADVYAMPSYGEGFGFVFLEALACGTPVVGSRLDGGREALRDGALGALVDPHRPEEIEAAVLDALDRKRAIPDGLAYFAFPNFSAQLRRVMGKLMAGGDAAGQDVACRQLQGGQ